MVGYVCRKCLHKYTFEFIPSPKEFILSLKRPFKMKKFAIVFALFFPVNRMFAQTQPAHIVICILENHAYNEIHNNPLAPYINSLLNDTNCAVLPQSFGLTHPSQPNYLMLFSGSDQGVVNDNVPSGTPYTTPNLGAALLQHSFTFTGYSETMPYSGYTYATSGKYARKHNPWVNWQGTGLNSIPSSLNQPLTSFPNNFSTLPTVSFVIPNLDNDMHDGTIATGDTWIQNHLSSYVQWCKTNNSLFILTFDEDDKSANNQILTMFVGQDIQGGIYNQTITHYNVLRTLEDLYNLPLAGHSADSSFIRDIWRTILPVSLISFTATKDGNFNAINWSSAKEINASKYELQKGTDGKVFSTIYTVSSSGSNSHYNYIDNHLERTNNYYRLKMLDKDGHYQFSKIINIHDKLDADLIIYPNPVADFVCLTLINSDNTKIKIDILNLEGKTVIEKYINAENGFIKIIIPVSFLPKGNYFLKFNKDGEDRFLKFVKQ